MAENPANSVTIKLDEAHPGLNARLAAHVITTFLNAVELIDDPLTQPDQVDTNRLVLDQEGLTLVMKPDHVAVATRIADTLRSSLDTDLALSNALTNFPTGAIDNLRSMIKAIADRETICQITTPSGTFNYESTEHMWVTLNNLSPENIQESHAECAGQFEGYLTNARSAEYRRTKPGDLILATIAPNITDHVAILDTCFKPAVASITARTVGDAHPTYTITSFALEELTDLE